MEPIDYLRIIKRWWKLIVACVVIAAAVAWVTTPAQPGPAVSTFEASHILIREAEERGAVRESAGTVALYVTAGEVPQRVADRLDFPGDPALLASEVTTEANETLGTISITVQDRDGLRAAQLANAFAEETLSYLTEQVQVEQQRQTDVLVQRLDDLEARIAEFDAQIGGAGVSQASLLTAQRDALVRQFSVAYEQFQQFAAEGPPSPAFTSLQVATPIPVTDTGFAPPSSRAGRAAGAAGLALVLGGLLALALERIDTKVRTKEGAERAFRLPVVAEIPKTALRGRGRDAIVTLAQPQSLAAEAYRNLRSSLLLMPRRPPDAPPGGWVGTRGGLHGRDPLDSELPHPDEPLVVLVTSPGAGDGKTTTVANLAVAFAETGRSVLVLGADLRRPKVHTYLEVETGPGHGPGLSDILRGGPGAPTLTEAMHMTAVPGVAMVPSGTVSGRPGELFGSRQHLIEEARELADVVLIDTAPLLLTNDAVELAPAVDAVIVVCRSGRTSNEASVRASEILARLGARVTGVALVAPPRTFSSAYYDSYYGDGRDGPGPDEHPGVPGRTLKERSNGAANGRYRQGASPPRGG